jgi:hypothetical protein
MQLAGGLSQLVSQARGGGGPLCLRAEGLRRCDEVERKSIGSVRALAIFWPEASPQAKSRFALLKMAEE